MAAEGENVTSDKTNQAAQTAPDASKEVSYTLEGMQGNHEGLAQWGSTIQPNITLFCQFTCFTMKVAV